jgi:EAL domain-containing protein (putative c-di-GMP-specific phosphodiesterase class I)
MDLPLALSLIVLVALALAMAATVLRLRAARSDVRRLAAIVGSSDEAILSGALEAPSERMSTRRAWSEIEAAIDAGRFVLHAQPIMSLDGAAEGRHELLLRMVGDEGDLILPGTFLHIAEHADLVQRLDRWVVENAVEILAEQERQGRDVIFEVNLSGKSINPPMAELIARTVGAAGVNPARLTFEVTETAAIVNLAQAKTFAEQLHEIGATFALDDFGAGFASFYYLKHLAFDYLKIDGEFIQGLGESRTNQLVVRSVVNIARGLEKRTIAEFVGDQATVDLLREYGVDYAQGFFVGRPVPVSEVDFELPTAGLSPDHLLGR